MKVPLDTWAIDFHLSLKNDKSKENRLWDQILLMRTKTTISLQTPHNDQCRFANALLDKYIGAHYVS